MAFDLLAAQRGAAVVLGASVALLAGACLARRWLATSACAWSAVRARRLDRLAVGMAAVALLADLAVLWLEAASMAGVPLGEVASAVPLVLGSTHFGTAWAVGAGALVVAGLAAALAKTGPRRPLLPFAPLAVFWFAQAMTSHAADAGDFSLFMVAYAAHLALISLWVGDVLAAGAVLAGPAPGDESAHRARAVYVQALSGSATLALAGIFVTGLYLAWHILGSVANLFGNPYGNVLLAKLALVGLAAALGAFNRFRLMPAMVAPQAGGPAPEPAARGFRRVLWIEAGVLLAVLAVAAILGSSAPPGVGT